MTVADIKSLINNMNDTDKVIFVTEQYDRDGYPYETETYVKTIVPQGTERINVGCGVMRFKREGL